MALHNVTADGTEGELGNGAEWGGGARDTASVLLSWSHPLGRRGTSGPHVSAASPGPGFLSGFT